MFTHTLTRAWSGDNGSTVSYRVSMQAGQEINVSEATLDESAPMTVACAIDQSQLKSILINCDKDATVVAKLASSTVDTFTMKANQPIAWASGDPGACPLTGDIDNFVVTTATVGTFNVRGLIDPTV
jgi:hypothetical protein